MANRPGTLSRRSLLAFAAATLAARPLLAEPDTQPAGTQPATTQPATGPRPTRVVYLEGPPRWEYRHLRNELVRSRAFDATTFLFGPDGTVTQEGDRKVARSPQTDEEWDAFDVALIGDLDPRRVMDAQLAGMARFVDRGGGLAIIAGPQFAPAAYAKSPLAAVLPVTIPDKPPAPPPGDEGFRLARTPEGRRAACFRMLDDEAANERWLTEGIPPLFWYARGVSAKQGATVWAEHPTDAGTDGRKTPILVVGPHGKGKAAFVGIDDTWRWRSGTNNAYGRFWSGLLEHLRPADGR